MDFAHALGLDKTDENPQEEREKIHLYINLKLASSGQPTCIPDNAEHFFGISRDLLRSYREKNRLLSGYQYPVDRRIQEFIERYLSDLDLPSAPALPAHKFMLDRHGVARELSLPLGRDEFHSDIVSSYRLANGVLHNPASDRRTTKGSFHVTEGGLPIPGDKKAVPKVTFARMLERAFSPSEELMTIPFTSQLDEPARMFVSLLLRPVVCPEIPGVQAEKTMEVEFIAPGNLSATSTLSRASLAMAAIPSYPNSMPRWTWNTGPAPPAASFSPPTWWA